MRRRMRLRHRRTRRASRRYGRRFSRRSTKSTIWGLAGKVVPIAAFLDQVTGKGRAAGKYNGTMIQNAQTLVNNITGNAFGVNLLPGGQTFTQQINPAGMMNKYTAIGIAGIVGSMVTRHSGIKVAGLGRIFALARKTLIPGLVGGFIDDAPGVNYSPMLNNAQTNNSISQPMRTYNSSGSVLQ